MVEYVNDFNFGDTLQYDVLLQNIDRYQLAINNVDLTSYLAKRHKSLFDEVKGVIELLRKSDLEKIKSYINSTHYLFRGTNGLRHMFYMGYKVSGDHQKAA